MIHIFHHNETSTTERWIRLAREILSPSLNGAKIGAGTFLDFAEINRQHPPIHCLDQVTYAASPQVHATDNKSILENLPGLGATATSARYFCKDLPLHVGPITLKPRLPIRDGGITRLVSEIDPRQSSLFIACWLVGALKSLGEAGVESLTVFEGQGDRGILFSPDLDGFSKDLEFAFPSWWVLSRIAPFTDGLIVTASSTHPMLAQALSLSVQNKRRSLITNTTSQLINIELFNSPAQVYVHYLEGNIDGGKILGALETSTQEVDKSDGSISLSLKPYAVACVDTI